MVYDKFTILLVDDDVDDAELILYTLRKINGLSVIHINDGQQALSYLLENQNPKPDLVLLDLKMPKVDGIQILKQLKANPEKSRIPIVALISSKEGRKYVESQGVVADSYLMKPVECKNFIEVVAALGLPSFTINHPYQSN